MSNHRIFSAMESVVLNTKLDSDAAASMTINQLKEDLVGAMKYIVELRGEKSKIQNKFEAYVKDSEAKMSEIEVELTKTLEALRSEERAHELHKQAWASSEASLEKSLEDARIKIMQREDALEDLGNALEEEQRRAAEDQDTAEREMLKMIDQREQLQRDSAVVVSSYKQQVSELQSYLQAERTEHASTQRSLQSSVSEHDTLKRRYAALEEAMENETRRLNGQYLRSKGDVREANEALEDARVEAEMAADAAQKRELELLDQLEASRREVAKAKEGERVSGQRMEKALLNRATAIVESQAERSLREATETSKVFDSVRYDVSYDQQERNDLDRVLDAATYKLQEVSSTNQAILQSSQRFGR